MLDASLSVRSASYNRVYIYIVYHLIFAKYLLVKILPEATKSFYGVIFYEVRVVWKESRRFVLLRTSCFHSFFSHEVLKSEKASSEEVRKKRFINIALKLGHDHFISKPVQFVRHRHSIRNLIPMIGTNKFMEQSPWEANSCIATQDTSKFHCSVRKNLPLVHSYITSWGFHDFAFSFVWACTLPHTGGKPWSATRMLCGILRRQGTKSRRLE
jgi:hypothetical protein